MERTAIKSHVLISVGYDPATRTLQVEFPRRVKDNARAVYDYHDVPPERFQELMQGKPENPESEPSIGSYFLRMIRPNYKFTRIEEKDETETQKDASPVPPPEAA